MPPITGMAMGFMISLPVEVDHKTGERAATVVTVVMIMGRILLVPASIMAEHSDFQFSGFDVFVTDWR